MMVLHFFIVALTFFESGYGQDPCNWSKRIIPRGAAGNFTIEVPIHNSYRSGYINGEPFGTYFWSRGWCTHKEDYFRCLYGNRNQIHTTILTLPKVEDISYVMLKDSFPITLHRPEDETVPGFYVKEGDVLDVCSNYTTYPLSWSFNGNENDLKDQVSCYQNGEKFCSGLGVGKTGTEDKCAFWKTSDRIRIRYRFFKPSTRFGYYYCYLDKGMTKALTYIVDWKNGKKTRDNSSTVTESPKPPNPSTSSASIILGEISLVWLWSFLASQV
ncbi:hypothetical protein SprV_0602079400 [Sparganum proliferum]